MVGELLHVRVPLPRWGHYGHRECIAQPVAQSIYENLVLVKGGSVGIFVSRKPGRIRLVGAGVAGKKGGDPWVARRPVLLPLPTCPHGRRKRPFPTSSPLPPLRMWSSHSTSLP